MGEGFELVNGPTLVWLKCVRTGIWHIVYDDAAVPLCSTEKGFVGEIVHVRLFGAPVPPNPCRACVEQHYETTRSVDFLVENTKTQPPSSSSSTSGS